MRKSQSGPRNKCSSLMWGTCRRNISGSCQRSAALRLVRRTLRQTLTTKLTPETRCDSSQQRFHSCFETFHCRLLSRWEGNTQAWTRTHRAQRARETLGNLAPPPSPPPVRRAFSGSHPNKTCAQNLKPCTRRRKHAGHDSLIVFRIAR